MVNKKIGGFSVIVIALVVGMVFGKFILAGHSTPPIDKMSLGELTDAMVVLQQDKDKQVNDLNMEETMQFLGGDESKFASINKQIEELSGMIERLSNSTTPKYEIYRQKFTEMEEKSKPVEKTASQLLEEGLGLGTE